MRFAWPDGVPQRPGFSQEVEFALVAADVHSLNLPLIGGGLALASCPRTTTILGFPANEVDGGQSEMCTTADAGAVGATHAGARRGPMSEEDQVAKALAWLRVEPFYLGQFASVVAAGPAPLGRRSGQLAGLLFVRSEFARGLLEKFGTFTAGFAATVAA